MGRRDGIIVDDTPYAGRVIDLEGIQEFRCHNKVQDKKHKGRTRVCRHLLMKGDIVGTLEIRCPKCKKLNPIRVL